jgi:hypothetical protein
MAIFFHHWDAKRNLLSMATLIGGSRFKVQQAVEKGPPASLRFDRLAPTYENPGVLEWWSIGVMD